MAAGSSAAALTLLMPTLEPRLQGFTKQGTPTASTTSRARAVRRARQSRRRTITCSTTGRPWARNTVFIVALSMPTAEASTPAPT